MFLHRYCFALDRGSVDDVMSLFADECDLELRLGQLHRGREAVHTWYEVLTRKRMDVLRHQVHNQVIELRGEEASSQSYWDVVGDLNGEAMISAGFYEDTLRKRDGEWRFEKRGSGFNRARLRPCALSSYSVRAAARCSTRRSCGL